MVVKEASTISPSEYYSHIDCFCVCNGIPRGDLEAIKKVKMNGNFRVSLATTTPNDVKCGYCQLTVR